MRETIVKTQTGELHWMLYDHGGSRIYLVDANGDRQLIADTYEHDMSERIWDVVLRYYLNAIEYVNLKKCDLPLPNPPHIEKKD